MYIKLLIVVCWVSWLTLGTSVRVRAEEEKLLYHNDTQMIVRLVPYMTPQTLVGNQFVVTCHAPDWTERVLVDLAGPARPHLDLPPGSKTTISLVAGGETQGGLGFRVHARVNRQEARIQVGHILFAFKRKGEETWTIQEEDLGPPFAARGPNG